MKTGNNLTTDNQLCISVDYIAFTITEGFTVDTLLSMYGLSLADFVVKPKGGYGYRSLIVHNTESIRVYYDGNEDMGIHVEVTGSAIPYFLKCFEASGYNVPTPFGFAYDVDSFDITVLADLFRQIMGDGHLTRLDLAIDDKGAQYYTLKELSDCVHQGAFSSRFRSHKEILEFGNGKSGHTIYFGSRESDIMLRVYDKKLEQCKKGMIVGFDWTRWELELHKKRASAVARLLIDGSTLSEIAFGLLSNYLRLVVLDNNNISRCSTAEKWAAFLDGFAKIVLTQPQFEKTLRQKKDWLFRQVAPSLSAVYQIDGLDFIYKLLECGNVRISASLHRIIESAVTEYENSVA